MRTPVLPLSTVFLLAGATPAVAQLISIRTVPISQSHQFDLFPSLRLGMGGVSIAVDDSLGDPFGNPAKGGRIRSSTFFGSPGLYSVSSGAGAGRTLPLGAVLRSGSWFGTASLAVQQVELSERGFFGVPVLVRCLACEARGLDFQTAPPGRANGNAYGYAMVGKVLAGGLSIGGSLLWAGLGGVDGVDLLYAGSANLEQRGHALDLRLGALKELDHGRSLSALLLHNRYASRHDVLYLDPIWDPGDQQFTQRPRLEENLDHTNTWGLQLEYRLPLRAPGWKVGWVVTANAMSHPKIPNYEIQNIPRDPGNSEAFNVGVGVSKRDHSSTLGVDLVYEPIWSYTWADAAGPVQTATGTTIPSGGKTIENRFRFSNAILRMGLAQELPFDQATKGLGIKLGLAVHSINYSLAQRDNVQARSRRLDEGWVEWTPTWGLSLRFPAWEIHYRGSLTNGTGRPGVFGGGRDVIATEPIGGNILVAPAGPLSISAVRVMTHQIAVSFPLR